GDKRATLARQIEPLVQGGQRRQSRVPTRDDIPSIRHAGGAGSLAGTRSLPLIPAQAGIQPSRERRWVPAFAQTSGRKLPPAHSLTRCRTGGAAASSR